MNDVQLKQPVLRVRALAEAVGLSGRVQVGWLMRQVDAAGTLVAERLTGGWVATRAINALQFAAPVWPGEVVSLYVEKLRQGETSITLKISVETERAGGVAVTVTEIIATFVAIDGDGRSRKIAVD
ncbi:MAG TPA: acyl-CoA thioesterase [Chromobacteriaceae bacterium]|nr:acyl-CoA thioesterase [Chromobacteriaceae bacterium]